MATRAEINTILLEERHRILAVLESAEGQRNPKMARELAIRRGMDAGDACALLRDMPASENAFLEAMAVHGPVGIAPPAVNVGPVDPKEAKRAEIKASMQAYNSRYAQPARG